MKYTAPTMSILSFDNEAVIVASATDPTKVTEVIVDEVIGSDEL